MVQNHTPYEYGDVDLEAVGEGPPHELQHGRDMIIVDGSTMSYRSYTRPDPQ